MARKLLADGWNERTRIGFRADDNKGGAAPPSRLLLIRFTQVTAIFGIGHRFRKLIATTYSGNLSQPDKHEPT